jgi:hypothetical protein
MKPSIVMYKDQYFLFYKQNKAGLAQLINSGGNKFSGTPHIEKLSIIKELPVKSFNGHEYVSTKQGIFSCSTGKRITHPEIIKLFSE